MEELRYLVFVAKDPRLNFYHSNNCVDFNLRTRNVEKIYLFFLMITSHEQFSLSLSEFCGKIMIKFTLEQVTKARMGRRGITVLFL
jgi:hypothetical protein